MYKIAKHKIHQTDFVLMSIIAILLLVGLIVLASASAVLSQEKFDESFYFLKHQLIYSLPLGLLAFCLGYIIYYKFWQKIALLILVLSLVLLAMVFVPGLGSNYGGATRWIDLGFISFQPAEVVKLSFIIYLAALLDKKKGKLNSFVEGLLPFLIIITILSILLITQPDFSTLLLIILIGFMIYFLAGARISHLLAIGVLGIISLVLLVKMAEYRLKRLTVFLHPELDPQGIGYQINQALLAIGAGGLFGRGLGHSIQKHMYLPEVIGDSIFAIAAEELGLIGATVIVMAFIMIAWRGFTIAKHAPDLYGRLVAAGITAWIVFQAFINIASISGLIPLTGIPLPFISYGSSSLVMLLAASGILLNISKYTN